ncbi:hypothetical protein CPAR01_02490 [Colletotrichum paranaense]|uniref:Secreted protein n=1 Tax=Colletotrichum paranaense TaxID=1914294 RepID=A0ABQ9SZR1_9PEZI|nr:uncharacterized protein CPAR01_02490 [Colletotrichum paranaense]KAK1544988.1 hypothetical protein CPAR01_02490 [Colletotrichum paranaense]
MSRSVVCGVLSLVAWMRLKPVYAGNCNAEVAREKMQMNKMQNGKPKKMAKRLLAKSPLLRPLPAVTFGRDMGKKRCWYCFVGNAVERSRLGPALCQSQKPTLSVEFPRINITNPMLCLIGRLQVAVSTTTDQPLDGTRPGHGRDPKFPDRPMALILLSSRGGLHLLIASTSYPSWSEAGSVLITCATASAPATANARSKSIKHDITCRPALDADVGAGSRRLVNVHGHRPAQYGTSLSVHVCAVRWTW